MATSSYKNSKYKSNDCAHRADTNGQVVYIHLLNLFWKYVYKDLWMCCAPVSSSVCVVSAESTERKLLLFTLPTQQKEWRSAASSSFLLYWQTKCIPLLWSYTQKKAQSYIEYISNVCLSVWMYVWLYLRLTMTTTTALISFLTLYGHWSEENGGEMSHRTIIWFWFVCRCGVTTAQVWCSSLNKKRPSYPDERGSISWFLFVCIFECDVSMAPQLCECL